MHIFQNAEYAYHSINQSKWANGKPFMLTASSSKLSVKGHNYPS